MRAEARLASVAGLARDPTDGGGVVIEATGLQRGLRLPF